MAARSFLGARRAGVSPRRASRALRRYVQRLELPPKPWPAGALFQVPSAAGPSDNFFVGYTEAVHLAWPRQLPEPHDFHGFDPRRWAKWSKDSRHTVPFDKSWICGTSHVDGYRPIGTKAVPANLRRLTEVRRRRLFAPEECFRKNSILCSRVSPKLLHDYALHNIKHFCGGRSWVEVPGTPARDFNFFHPGHCANRTGSPSCSHKVDGRRYTC